jgi:hypothetical protein
VLRRNPTTGMYGCCARAVSAVPMSCLRVRYERSSFGKALPPNSGGPLAYVHHADRRLSRPRSQVRSGANRNVLLMWNSPLLDGIEAARGTQVPAPRCWNLRDLLGEETSWSGNRRTAAAHLLRRVHRGHHVRRNPAPLTKQKQSRGHARAAPSLTHAADRRLWC